MPQAGQAIIRTWQQKGVSMSTSSITDYASSLAPWRKGVAWWVILIQGIILAALGGWTLWRTASAVQVLFIAIGVYLVITAIWVIVQAMRGSEAGFSIFGLLASGGGLAAGLALITPPLLLTLDEGQKKVLFVAFGVAMVAIGLLSMLGAILERRTGSISWMAVVRAAAFLLVGALLIVGLRRETAAVAQWIAWVALGVGVLLIIYAVLLMRSQRASTAQPSAA